MVVVVVFVVVLVVVSVVIVDVIDVAVYQCLCHFDSSHTLSLSQLYFLFSIYLPPCLYPLSLTLSLTSFLSFFQSVSLSLSLSYLFFSVFFLSTLPSVTFDLDFVKRDQSDVHDIIIPCNTEKSNRNIKQQNDNNNNNLNNNINKNSSRSSSSYNNVTVINTSFQCDETRKKIKEKRGKTYQILTCLLFCYSFISKLFQ